MKKVILISLLLIATISCRTIKSREQTSKIDSTWITQRPIVIKTTGGKTPSVNVDSILAILLQMQKGGNGQNRIFYIPDTSGKAMLKFWMDESGKIRADCEAKDQQYTAIVNEYNRLVQEKSNISKTKVSIPFWVWVVLSCAGLGFLIMSVFIVFLLFHIAKK